MKPKSPKRSSLTISKAEDFVCEAAVYESIASSKTCSNKDNSEALLRNAVKAKSGTPEDIVLFCVSLKLFQSNSYPVKIFHFTALPFLENFIPDTQRRENNGHF